MLSVETYSLYCLIYIIPGCVFYCIYAFHLFTKKEFKTAFFNILKILAFVDLAALLLSCICMRAGYLLSQVSFLQSSRMSSSQSPGSSSFQPPPGLPGSFPPPGSEGHLPPPGPQGSLPPPGPQGSRPPPGPSGPFPPQESQGLPFQPPGSQVQLPLPGPQGFFQPSGPPGSQGQPPSSKPQGSPQKPGPVEPPGIFFRQPTEDYNIISTLLGFGMVVFGGIQACLHVILAFNRLTAILFPHRYRTFWNGKSFYAIVSLAFITPSFLYFWILYYGANVLMSPVFVTYVIDTLRTPIPWLHKATINTVIITITCVMAFAFDIMTFILLQKRNFVKTDPSKYNQEFRLLTVSVAFLIVHTLGLFTAIYTLTFPIKDGMFLLIFLQTTSEIQSLISPFCVLIVNRNLRQDIFRRKSNTISVTIIRGSRPSI